MNIKLASEQGPLEPTALTQTVCCYDLGTWFREGIWKKGNHILDEPEDESNPLPLVHTHTLMAAMHNTTQHTGRDAVEVFLVENKPALAALAAGTSHVFVFLAWVCSTNLSDSVAESCLGNCCGKSVLLCI